MISFNQTPLTFPACFERNLITVVTSNVHNITHTHHVVVLKGLNHRRYVKWALILNGAYNMLMTHTGNDDLLLQWIVLKTKTTWLDTSRIINWRQSTNIPLVGVPSLSSKLTPRFSLKLIFPPPSLESLE